MKQVAVSTLPDSVDRAALQRLLDPRSIAIIGASANATKRGFQTLRSLQKAGFTGDVYPVNPNEREILGLRVYRSVDELPRNVDAALISLPASAVPDALRECAKAGIPGAVVLAHGFKEIGEAGHEAQRALEQAIAETGVRVIGPNTSGMINVTSGANLVGLQDVPKGPISIVTQSGNMLLSLVNDNRTWGGPGFHAHVGLGNQVDVGYAECISELGSHPNTGAVAVHSEGFNDGRAFLVSAASTVRETPVVLLRGGRTEVGQQTALSHTGSIAGSDAVATAVLRQAGVELVSRSDELAIVAGALATTPPLNPGRRVAILSDGGGHATLAADALSSCGIELAELSQASQGSLRELLGHAAAVSNPVDAAGATDTDPSIFADAVKILMADEAVGLVLVVGLFGGYFIRFNSNLRDNEDETADRLVSLSSESGKPLVMQTCYADNELQKHYRELASARLSETSDRHPSRPGALERLRAGGVPVIGSIDHAVRIVSALDSRGKYLDTHMKRTSFVLPNSAVFGAPREGLLTEPTARELVQEAGIDLGDWVFARELEEAAKAVREFGGPCALKVVSSQVVHKSDVGGVRLNVTADTVEHEIAALYDAVLRNVPDAVIEGLVVTPMAPKGVELLIGATQDPIFGPVVAFGSGGVLVEALQDVTFRAAPLTELEAREMISETVASRMLDGYRNLPVVDRDALAKLLVAVGDLVATHRDIAELDLNPVIASADGVIPVDVRVVIAKGNTNR